MTETRLLAKFRTARAEWEANPCTKTAIRVAACATALCCITDDYAALLDEADDIIAEAEG
jgi:hypothetical protein